jgi:hypothetical protein
MLSPLVAATATSVTPHATPLKIVRSTLYLLHKGKWNCHRQGTALHGPPPGPIRSSNGAAEGYIRPLILYL